MQAALLCMQLSYNEMIFYAITSLTLNRKISPYGTGGRLLLTANFEVT